MTEKTEQGDYKSELRKKFEDWYAGKDVFYSSRASRNQFFDFFYSEIEAREKEIEFHGGRECLSKITHLEGLVKASEEIIKTIYMTPVRIEVYREQYLKALEAYNKLKSSQKH